MAGLNYLDDDGGAYDRNAPRTVATASGLIRIPVWEFAPPQVRARRRELEEVAGQVAAAMTTVNEFDRFGERGRGLSRSDRWRRAAARAAAHAAATHYNQVAAAAYAAAGQDWTMVRSVR